MARRACCGVQTMGWSDSFKSQKPKCVEEDPIGVDQMFARRRGSSTGRAKRQRKFLGRYIFTARERRHAFSTMAPHDYIHRCGRENLSHPLYRLSYFMYTWLVKSEYGKGGNVLVVAFRRDDAHVVCPPYFPPPSWGVSVGSSGRPI